MSAKQKKDDDYDLMINGWALKAKITPRCEITSNADGELDCKNSIIKIADDIDNQNQFQTLIHELAHAYCRETAIDWELDTILKGAHLEYLREEIEDTIIQKVAAMFYNILILNRDFFKERL